MSRVCAECGKELSVLDEHLRDGRSLCGTCVKALREQSQPASPVAKRLSAMPVGGGVAIALRFFAWLSIAGGVIFAIKTIDSDYLPLVLALVGVLYAVLLFGVAVIIDLLRVIAGSAVREE